MKRLLIFVFLNLSFGVFCQNESQKSIVSPIISAGFSFYSYNSYNSSSRLILLNNYKLSGGVQLFERWNVTGNVGFLNTQHLITSETTKIKAIPLSISMEYRFFKDFWISPMIGFETGGIVHSNAINKKINSGLELDDDAAFNDTFKNWRGFMSPQVLISFKIKNIYLNLGAGYSMLFFNTSDYLQRLEKQTVYGIELKAGISYRF